MNNSKFSIREIFILLFLIIILIQHTQLFSEKPKTIPAIREWIDFPGRFVFTPKSKIIIDKNYYDELFETALTFSEDIMALKSFKPEVISGDSAGGSDFFMTLSNNDDTIGKEGYEMFVGDSIHLKAMTSDGIFYGTRTILQMLKNSDTINGGFALDFPNYPERAFMVDIGRKYFSLEWMENKIKELAYIKMNYFHWHISDNPGFRIESTSHPEITSEQHYTKQEIRHLLDLARKYHVVIIPEIDMPGHMGAILKNNLDEFALKDVKGGISNSFLDFTTESSREFVKEIITEFIDLFPGPFWHSGVDEYIYDNFDNFPQFLNYAKQIYGDDAKAGDALFGFINWMNKLVREKGKTLRIWNDPISKLSNKGGKAVVDTNIIIEYWQGEDEPKDIVKSGYHVTNCSIDFLYYNLGCSWVGYNEFLYERWNPNIYQGEKKVSDSLHKNNGAKYHIWCENSDRETEGHVSLVIELVLKILSQGLWGSPKLVQKIDEFTSIADSVGLAPGVIYPENPMPGNIAFKKKVSSESIRKNSVFIPQRITDGNRNTQWQSDIRETSWIFVDLEDTFRINKLRLIWFYTPPKEFYVQISNDSIVWHTIKNYRDTTSFIMDINELNVVGRYVRIYFNQHSDSTFYSLWEIEAYGSKYSDNISENYFIISNGKVFPNPFDSSVNIEFYLNADTLLSVKVFDYNGNEVECLNNGYLFKGWHNLHWNGENYSRGEYNIIMKIGNNAFNMKTILIK